MTPWFGLHLPNYTFPDTPPERLFDRVVELASAAETAGFGLVTGMDHFYQIRGVGPETDPMLEVYTMLAALSQRTGRVRLGALVTGVTYRNPAILAKIVTTLDVVSGGRAVLGLGAAWNEEEHAGYGADFPPVRERMDRLDEALTICRLMFTEDRPSFAGHYYRIDRALNVPRPIQPGGPKIIVGGGGEQRTLKIAAKHADMTHWFPLGLETLLHKKAVLEEHCAAIGRDPATIELTMATPVLLATSDADGAALLARLPPERRAAGGDHSGAGRGGAPTVPRRRLHRLHVQQPGPADGRGDRPGRRGASAHQGGLIARECSDRWWSDSPEPEAGLVLCPGREQGRVRHGRPDAGTGRSGRACEHEEIRAAARTRGRASCAASRRAEDGRRGSRRSRRPARAARPGTSSRGAGFAVEELGGVAVAQVRERDLRRARSPVSVGDGDEHAVAAARGEGDVFVGVGVLVALLGAAPGERDGDAIGRRFADGADVGVVATGEQDGVHVDVGFGSGFSAKRRLSTGRPPITCSCRIRSSASGVQLRYQVPSG